MKNFFKLVFGISLSIVGLVSIFISSFLGGLLLMTTGFLIIPSISAKVETKLSIWSKKKNRRISLASMGFIAVIIVANSSSIETPNDADNKVTQSIYKSYLDNVDVRLSNFSEDDLKSRNAVISKLKENNVYVNLIDSNKVDADYLPVLTAISDGLTKIKPDGFAIQEELVNRVKNEKIGDEGVSFVIGVVTLAQPNKGGLTKELVRVFEEYRKQFGYYGKAGTVYNSDASKKASIEYSYDLAPIFGILDPKNKKVLNSLYEARSEGISTWNDEGNYVFNYLATSKGYNDYLKSVYPESKYFIEADFELTASSLFNKYKANEVAADEVYLGKKIAVTGIIDDIGKDILDDPYISLEVGYLESVNCYFSESDIKAIAQLSKGQKITILGTCKGMTLTIGVTMSQCKLLNGY